MYLHRSAIFIAERCHTLILPIAFSCLLPALAPCLQAPNALLLRCSFTRERTRCEGTAYQQQVSSGIYKAKRGVKG